MFGVSNYIFQEESSKLIFQLLCRTPVRLRLFVWVLGVSARGRSKAPLTVRAVCHLTIWVLKGHRTRPSYFIFFRHFTVRHTFRTYFSMSRQKVICQMFSKSLTTEYCRRHQTKGFKFSEREHIIVSVFDWSDWVFLLSVTQTPRWSKGKVDRPPPDTGRTIGLWPLAREEEPRSCPVSLDSTGTDVEVSCGRTGCRCPVLVQVCSPRCRFVVV